MYTAMLSTSTGVPPPGPHLVERGRLTDRLERGVPTHALTLVAAPAGYGKTTLLSDWARRTGLPVAWLTIEPADNAVDRFLRHVLRAWAREQPDVTESPAGILLGGIMMGGMAPDIDQVLAAIIDTVADRQEPLAIVMDDYHLIEEPAVHEAVTYLLDHHPETLRVVIASREAPPLPLSRYRARRQLLEIGPVELQFLPMETETLFNDALGLSLSAEAAATLGMQVEGWAAGLQLAALTFRADASAPVIAISGRHRFIADFLRDEVLAQLPADTSDFLVRTSVVDRLCGSLCDAITGQADSQAMLERLERQNLFTLPLDDNREWFRYHRLFSDVLAEELKRKHPDEITGLHRRAAEWYLRHDSPEPAFDHALAAADLPTMYAVLDGYGLVQIFTGQFQTLRGWLEALPDSWYEQQPELSLLRVALMLYSGQFEAGIQLLGDIEAAIMAAEVVNDRTMGRVTAIRCFIACETNNTEQAERFAEVALAALPSSDNTFRNGIWGALGDVYRRNGRWSDAHAHYLRALSHTTTPAAYIQSVHAYGALADLELRQGHLHRAADYWRRAKAVLDDERSWGAYEIPVIGWVYIRMGEILYEWNDLDTAMDYTARGRERALLGGDPRSIIAGTLLKARLHLARGQAPDADAAIEQIRPVVAEAQFPEWTSEFERFQVELWLAEGKLRSAVTWSDEALARDPANLPDQEPIGLAIAHVLVQRGDTGALDEALTLLGPLVDSAATDGRTGLLIAALSLRAMALRARGDHSGALTELEHAMRLAEPEGYVRVFVDLGLPLARLLQEARHRGVMPDYVDRLLAAVDTSVLAGLPATSPLPEPLSEREFDVLAKLAAGLTNREIAAVLFISAETVKKHTGSIFAKLGVHNRTEAVARARELDLLDRSSTRELDRLPHPVSPDGA